MTAKVRAKGKRRSKAQTPWAVRAESERKLAEMYEAISELEVPDGWQQIGLTNDGIVISVAGRKEGEEVITAVLTISGEIVDEQIFDPGPYPPAIRTYEETVARLKANRPRKKTPKR